MNDSSKSLLETAEDNIRNILGNDDQLSPCEIHEMTKILSAIRHVKQKGSKTA